MRDYFRPGGFAKERDALWSALDEGHGPLLRPRGDAPQPAPAPQRSKETLGPESPPQGSPSAVPSGGVSEELPETTLGPGLPRAATRHGPPTPKPLGGQPSLVSMEPGEGERSEADQGKAATAGILVMI